MTEAPQQTAETEAYEAYEADARRLSSRDVLDMGLGTVANVTMHERWRTSLSRFGELTGAQLTSMASKLDRGYLDDWIDLVEFFLTTDSDFATLNAARITRLVQRKWTIQPAVEGDQRLAQLASEFCNEYVRRIKGLHQSFKNIAGALTPGFSANELMWKVDTKRACYMIDRIEWRHGHRFRYSPTWTLRFYDRGMQMGPDGYGEVLDPRKWIVLFYSDQPGYPSVYGLFRSVSWDLLFKRYAERFRITNVEKFGNPYIWMEVLGAAKPEVRDKALAYLQRMSSTQLMVTEVGNQLHFEMPGSMQSGGTPQQAYINDKVAALTRRYLGTSDATTPGEHGSNAAVATRTEAQTDPLTESDVQGFTDCMRDSLLTNLCRLNWHMFGVTDPNDIPIPMLAEAPKPKPAAPPVARVPEVSSGEPDEDRSEPERQDPPPEDVRMTRDPKASASGEPRRATKRSRITSTSAAILTVEQLPAQ